MKNELLGGPFRFSGPRVAILTGFYRICKVPLCTANVLVRASLDPKCRKFSDVERRLRSLKVTYAPTRLVLRAFLPEKERIPQRTEFAESLDSLRQRVTKYGMTGIPEAV